MPVMKDVLGDMMVGTMVGGVFGGALDAIVVNRMFKDTVKQLGIKRRNSTFLAITRMGLSGGDEMYSFVDSLLQLPEKFWIPSSLFRISSRLSRRLPTNLSNWMLLAILPKF